MAREAIFQITDIREHAVREVELTKAMVIYRDKPLELVMNLQLQRLISTQDDEYYYHYFIHFLQNNSYYNATKMRA